MKWWKKHEALEKKWNYLAPSSNNVFHTLIEESLELSL